MADDKTFTEEQHLAILADRVSKETAAVIAERDAETAAKVEAESKLDAAEAARVAAEQAKEKVQADFDAYKTELERLHEEGSRKDTRLATVKEAAAHMPEEFFADEKRIARIVAMDEDAFAGYCDDLKASSPAPGYTPPPRQTAMAGEAGTGGTSTSGSAASTVLLGRFGRGQSEKGA